MEYREAVHRESFYFYLLFHELKSLARLQFVLFRRPGPKASGTFRTLANTSVGYFGFRTVGILNSDGDMYTL